MENYYQVLNYTERLDNDKDHILVKIQLHSEKESVTINARIDSGATEEFIERGLQQTRDQDDQSKKPKGYLPCGRKTKRNESRDPYDESTYGH